MEHVLLEKLKVVYLVKKFPAFMEPETSLPCSKEPDTGPYCDPSASADIQTG
jgi:hypothetical protein